MISSQSCSDWLMIDTIAEWTVDAQLYTGMPMLISGFDVERVGSTCVSSFRTAVCIRAIVAWV